MSAEIGPFDRFAGRFGLGGGYGLLALDLLALAWVIGESFLPQGPALRLVDFGFGLVLGAELVLRLAASPRPWREATHPAGIADIIAVLAFLLAPFAPGWGFLRSLRTLRLLRSARLVAQLRRDLPLFRANPEAPIAAADLLVFIAVMTGIVHATQYARNPEIANWADALYFTVAALTTTGFGDITLDGTWGRLLTVIIMLCGVTLFLRLAQALFRPLKVRFRCPSCGLGRHDTDAVHCKACGIQLNIPDDEN
ncbi:two pore domain potassium channel family protein [Roseomonas frigidaquae]|uniref:Two pore domain potassium channel family protein n=1 Tax=Falsiroseomonas frigidaquae TaxID=487318 RepID=A0ABX1EWH0_9PROT|nr:potassium channel family protein [Falsiroseomonas frigidaquae]NKE44479.1 two pore domain potassium channel family protein [Falsiroseomonas frigidaquae]